MSNTPPTSENNGADAELAAHVHHAIDSSFVLCDDGVKRLSTTDATAKVMQLITAEKRKAEGAVIEKAHTPCECGKDHFGTPVRSVQGNITTYCQFSRIVPSDAKQAKGTP